MDAEREWLTVPLRQSERGRPQFAQPPDDGARPNGTVAAQPGAHDAPPAVPTRQAKWSSFARQKVGTTLETT